jgi:hypothetical protein
MKEYNNRRWWIDPDIIRPFSVAAEDVKTALNLWRERVEDRTGVQVSKNAMKNKSPMYIDQADGNTVQVGFVITGKSEFEDRDAYKYSNQYIDIWVTIQVVSYPEF